MRDQTFAHRVGIATILAFVLAAPSALAQEEETDEISGIEEIIVTITKRSESIQEVAASISAFSRDQIENQNIENVSDLVTLIPNVQIKGDGNGAITVRGISQSFTTQSPVSQHINGSFRYSSTSYGGLFYDIESINFSRGPSGVKYGRNATAGAVDVNWVAPHDQYEFFGDATFGNYDQRQFRGGGNIPLLGEGNERLMARFTLQRQVRDGYLDNRLDPSSEDHNNADTFTARLALRSELSEDLSFDLRGRYHQAKGNTIGGPLQNDGNDFPVGFIDLPGIGGLPFDVFDGLTQFKAAAQASPFGAIFLFHQVAAGFPAGPAGLDAATEDVFLNGFPGAPPLFPAVPAFIRDAQYFTPALSRPGGDRELNSTAHETLGGKSQLWGFEAGMDWLVRDLPLLGDVNVSLLGAFDRIEAEGGGSESDGSELEILDTEVPLDSTLYTGELRFTSENDGPFQWMAGFFYFKRHLDQLQSTIVPFGVFGFTKESEESGIGTYVHVTWQPVDALEFGAGVRWNRDKVSVEQKNLPNPLQASGPGLDASVIFRERTGKLEAKWHITDENMIYLTWARGYKSGNLELLIDSGLVNPVDPELIDAWEMGTRNELLEGRLQLNFTGFYYEYSALQVPFILATQIITENAAEATVWGLELELNYRPTPEFSIRFSAGFLDATFDEFCADDGLDLKVASDPGCPPNAAFAKGQSNLSGNRLEDSPKLNASLVASYEWDLGENGNLTGVLESTWSDEYYTRPFNVRVDRVAAYTKTDLRLIWASTDDRYSIELFGENLEDETVYARTIVVELAGSAAGFGLLPPRVYGIRFGYHWGGKES
jgi:outer membrane receptor protein involved in Fe transport